MPTTTGRLSGRGLFASGSSTWPVSRVPISSLPRWTGRRADGRRQLAQDRARGVTTCGATVGSTGPRRRRSPSSPGACRPSRSRWSSRCASTAGARTAADIRREQPLERREVSGPIGGEERAAGSVPTSIGSASLGSICASRRARADWVTLIASRAVVVARNVGASQTLLRSVLCQQIHASCTTSSASAAHPSTREAMPTSPGRTAWLGRTRCRGRTPFRPVGASRRPRALRPVAAASHPSCRCGREGARARRASRPAPRA
jgi:hypothetical protein